MSAPTGQEDFLHELKIEVEMELTTAESSHPEETVNLPLAEWLFDPTDAQRQEVGLRSLLGAIEAVEGDYQPGHRSEHRAPPEPGTASEITTKGSLG